MKRPQEWSKFVAKTVRGVRPYDNIPFIENSAEFGKAITEWWVSLQPSFRISEAGKTLPIYSQPNVEGDPWLRLRKSGPNGLVSLMTMMSWWGRGAAGASLWEGESVNGWRAIVADITLCVGAMLKTVPVLPRKRGRDNDQVSNGSEKKRSVCPPVSLWLLALTSTLQPSLRSPTWAGAYGAFSPVLF